MAFDVKEKVEEIISNLKKDPALMAQFKKEPVKAVEKVLGINLPDEQLKPVVDAVSAKLAAGDVAEKLGGLGKLFK